MNGVVTGEISRLIRRRSFWLLTLILVLMSVGVAYHNIGKIATARAELASAMSEHVLNGCVVFGANVPQQACEPVGQPVRTSPSSCPASAVCVSAGAPTQTPQQQIQSDKQHAVASLNMITRSLVPAQRVRLAVSLIASLPGILLAIFLGALIVGNDYQWSTWKTWVVASRRRIGLLAGKLAALWIAVLFWVLLGVTAALATYAALAHQVHVAPIGMPSGLLTPDLAAWVSLGLFATVAAAASTVTRSPLAAVGVSAALLVLFEAAPFLATHHELATGGPIGTSPISSTPWPLAVLAALGRVVPPAVAPGVRAGGLMTPTSSFGLPTTAGGPGGWAALVLLLGWAAALTALALAWFNRQELR